MSTYDEQHARSLKSYHDPQIGDYWAEMFCPYFIVVDRDMLGDYVILDKFDKERNFILNQPSTINLAELQRQVRYDSISPEKSLVACVWNTENTRAIAAQFQELNKVKT